MSAGELDRHDICTATGVKVADECNPVRRVCLKDVHRHNRPTVTIPHDVNKSASDLIFRNFGHEGRVTRGDSNTTTQRKHSRHTLPHDIASGIGNLTQVGVLQPFLSWVNVSRGEASPSVRAAGVPKAPAATISGALS